MSTYSLSHTDDENPSENAKAEKKKANNQTTNFLISVGNLQLNIELIFSKSGNILSNSLLTHICA